MHTTTRLSEMQRNRALAAGEHLGEAILATSRWVSRILRALHAPATAREQQAHTPR